MRQLQKRYQHWTKDGITWTDWFNTTTKTESLFKKTHLKEEYRYINVVSK